MLTVDTLREERRHCELVRPDALLACRFCNTVPPTPLLWTNESGEYSSHVSIACGCGCEVNIPLRDFDGGVGMSGWEIIYTKWKNALRTAQQTWNRMHAGEQLLDEAKAALVGGANEGGEMKTCDDCGWPMDVESDSPSGIILCDLCASDKRKTTEEIIAELEAEGVDVKTFMRRIYATIVRAKAQLTANTKENTTKGE